MSTKQKIITAYFSIALLFAFYGWLFGDDKYRGFAYNAGKALVWPTIIFPSLGAFIGGIIMVVVIGYIVFFAKKKDEA